MDAHPLRSLSWKERTFRIFLGIARSLRLCICQKQRLTNLLPLYRKIRKGRLKAAKNQGEKMSGIHTADRPMNFRKIDPPAKQIPRIPQVPKGISRQNRSFQTKQLLCRKRSASHNFAAGLCSETGKQGRQQAEYSVWRFKCVSWTAGAVRTTGNQPAGRIRSISESRGRKAVLRSLGTGKNPARTGKGLKTEVGSARER